MNKGVENAARFSFHWYSPAREHRPSSFFKPSRFSGIPLLLQRHFLIFKG